MMALREILQLLFGHRRGPTHLLAVSLVVGCTIVTLCLFSSHLPVVQQLSGVRPLAATTGESRMTSLQAPAPHHRDHGEGHHQGPSEAQVLLDLIKKEQAKKLAKLTMEYGANKHPPFKDDPPQLIADLPREHLPTYTPPSPTEGQPGEGNQTRRKRLVFVGDVHGQLSALKALLRKVGFDNSNGDHLVLAGDMVTKGPDSKGVVKLAMELGASAVRGNQDDKVLAAAREIRRQSLDDDSRSGSPAGDGEDDGEGNGNDNQADAETRRKDRARRVARSLTRAQLSWLRSLPIILRIGQIPGATSPPWNASTVVVVHGGLVPGVKLEKQDPWAVMNMRSLVYPRKNKGKGKKKDKHHPRSSEAGDSNEDEDSEEHTSDQDSTDTTSNTAVAVPIGGRNGEPWSHAWNRYQNRLPATTPHTLTIYGHDARAGLQVNLLVDISPYSSSSRSSRSPSPSKNHHHDLIKPPHAQSPPQENSSPSTKKTHNNKHKPKETGLRYAFGLDSGCGHGRQLTALVLEARVDGVGHFIEQVDCAETGFVAGAALSGEQRGEGVGESQKVVDSLRGGLWS